MRTHTSRHGAWAVGAPVAVALVALAVLGGCDTPLERMRAKAVSQQIESAQPVAVDPAPFETTLERHLIGVRRVAVRGPTGRALEVEARSSGIARYPCTQCHAEPLQRLRGRTAPGAGATHGDVLRPHAAKDTLTCQDCHDDAAGMGRLHRADGGAVDFDESFRVCAQCHFQQAAAWEGGAHGKRLVSWAGPRVVLNCTACHNPHDPLRPVVTPRFPAVVPNAPAHNPGSGH